ncbi:snRNA-activating protein complex subunit 5 [Cricetulus griseus]|uniref:snRNA-activating protein complex subunit 5 n=1 Tax=Cricetulus griseus TaxID=10029 RepID=G3IMY0_CRIGR|nr:snRNA-activating protein complex subunit 5 [Cricetulus griseus]
MFSRLQELRKEEETLLRLKAALHDQLNRLKVEELALQSMISSRRGTEMLSSQPAPEQLYDLTIISLYDNDLFTKVHTANLSQLTKEICPIPKV